MKGNFKVISSHDIEDQYLTDKIYVAKIMSVSGNKDYVEKATIPFWLVNKIIFAERQKVYEMFIKMGI